MNDHMASPHRVKKHFAGAGAENMLSLTPYAQLWKYAANVAVDESNHR